MENRKAPLELSFTQLVFPMLLNSCQSNSLKSQRRDVHIPLIRIIKKYFLSLTKYIYLKYMYFLWTIYEIFLVVIVIDMWWAFMSLWTYETFMIVELEACTRSSSIALILTFEFAADNEKSTVWGAQSTTTTQYRLYHVFKKVVPYLTSRKCKKTCIYENQPRFFRRDSKNIYPIAH